MDKRFVGALFPYEEVTVVNGYVYAITSKKIKWAESIVNKYAKCYNTHESAATRTVAVRHKTENSKRGVAWASPRDKWVSIIGRAIAISRAEKIPIPKFIYED